VPGLVLVTASAAFAQNRPSFTGVGDLAGGAVSSSADAVSADGTVVVGGSEGANGAQAFRWTAAGGIAALPNLSGGTSSQANGISADGTIVVGTAVDSSSVSHAVRWVNGGNPASLNTFTCCLCSSFGLGDSVSANGLVVVGASSRYDCFTQSVDAARWPGGGTSISDLGHLSGGGQASEARAASSDGSVIVGSSDSSSGVQAFRWTSGGMVALPNVPGAQVNAAAEDVSDAGSVVVGFANTNTSDIYQTQAVRWVGPGFGSAELLGALPGNTSPHSDALAVSPDGSRIVGTAMDETGNNTAFLWDATHGMRKLSQVLLDDYGIDVGAWQLTEAHGISAVNAAGEFTVVGSGVDPAGNPEGWVALLSPTACNDGIDNDGDGHIDWPDDPQCTSRGDRSETPDCSDGIDDDGDGLVDYPADPKCSSPADLTERFDCSDGIDDDGDGLVDYPADPGCRTASSPIEDPACDNGIDDDNDGQVDYPADKGCTSADDDSEKADCSDGIDNDGDGKIDYPDDPDCTSFTDPSEAPQCSDEIDNDKDGRADFPAAYPACQSPTDPTEKPECSDGIDNDGDGLVDYPADPGCVSATFGSESPVHLAIGDLLVLDRRSRSLFRLDPATGTQTVISAGAELVAPQGVAVRPSGAVVVADPAGLLQIAPSTGQQRLFSAPLQSNLSLQLVFDAAGDVVVMEKGALSRIPFVYAGVAGSSPLVTLPVAGTLGLFQGDALARESSGSLVVGGFGALGDGIYRISADGSSITKVTPGFSGDVWNDLAVQSDGAILGAGTHSGAAGVFRIDPGTGAVTALSNSGWTAPSAVAQGPTDRLFASDAGTCSESGCTGARVVELDPASGAVLHIDIGGDITGETDLAVVTALPACDNGIDDDGDGKVDFPADPNCRSFETPSELPACGNGIDDDGDGLVDYPADGGCSSASFNLENPQCSDGIDNDGDGKIDYAGGPNGEPPDPQCTGPFLNAESSGCGIGAELVLALPPLFAWRRRRLRRRS
jgi:probable HAF family extracellular repeat protein